MGYRTSFDIALKPGVALPEVKLMDDFGKEYPFLDDAGVKVTDEGTYIGLEWNETFFNNHRLVAECITDSDKKWAVLEELADSLHKLNQSKVFAWLNSMNPDDFYFLRGGCDAHDDDGNDIYIDERGNWKDNPFFSKEN